MNDLYKYVRDEEEEVLYRFSNTEKKLREDGISQFLFPGSVAGVFLIILGLILSRLFVVRIVVSLTYGLCALGVMLLFSSVIFFAMFLRLSRLAASTVLYLTNKNLVWCEGGRYAKLPLSDITDVTTARSNRFERVPFDMSSLEHEYILLTYRGGEMKIPFIEDPEQAAKKIKASLG